MEGPYWVKMGDEWSVVVVQNDNGEAFVVHPGNELRYPVAEYEGMLFMPIPEPEL